MRTHGDFSLPSSQHRHVHGNGTMWWALSEPTSALCSFAVHGAWRASPRALAIWYLKPGQNARSAHSWHWSATQHPTGMYSSNAYWLGCRIFFSFITLENITSHLNSFLNRVEVKSKVPSTWYPSSDWMPWWKVGMYSWKYLAIIMQGFPTLVLLTSWEGYVCVVWEDWIKDKGGCLCITAGLIAQHPWPLLSQSRCQQHPPTPLVMTKNIFKYHHMTPGQKSPPGDYSRARVWNQLWGY
jgi:hypothetical protein